MYSPTELHPSSTDHCSNTRSPDSKRRISFRKPVHWHNRSLLGDVDIDNSYSKYCNHQKPIVIERISTRAIRASTKMMAKNQIITTLGMIAAILVCLLAIEQASATDSCTSDLHVCEYCCHLMGGSTWRAEFTKSLITSNDCECVSADGTRRQSMNTQVVKLHYE